MKIRVTDWQYRNLRGIGAGELSIELGSPLKRWCLIQMPNGTGKTTTMKLIRAVLSGQKFMPEEVHRYRADDVVKEGAFELGLMIDDKQFRRKLSFDFENGGYSYSMLQAKERGGGLEFGRELPLDLRRRLRPNFTRLFVFDGELAKDIRAVDKAEADRAIKVLYQLDDLSALCGRVEDVVSTRQDAAAPISSAKSPQGMTQRRNALNKAESVLSELKKELSDLRETESELEEQRKQVEAKIKTHIDENGDLKAAEDEINSEAEFILGEVQSATIIAMDAFRMPTTLSPTIQKRLSNLGKTLTDARLPKSVSSEFFSELAKKETCICARPIGDEERAAILERKEDYLAKDQIAAISTMKEKLKNSGEPATSFQSTCTVLGKHIEAQRINEVKRNKLMQELADSGNEEVEKLIERSGEINTELGSLSEKIKGLEKTNPASKPDNNIPLARKRRDDCKEKLEVASGSYKLARQRDVLVRHLKEIEKRTLNDLRETIRKETNERLEGLVRMEKLRVAKIDGALMLTSDRVADRQGVSEGQSLSVAYAFLTSLLSKAPFQLPFIVDSPAGSLDLEVRREVSRIIPDLFNQMIMFVLTSEQPGFSETFYDREDTCFVSLSKVPDGDIHREYGLEAFKRSAEEETAP